MAGEPAGSLATGHVAHFCAVRLSLESVHDVVSASVAGLKALDGDPNGLAEASGIDGVMGSAGAVAASVDAPAKRSV